MTKKDIKKCINEHDYIVELDLEGLIMTTRPEECLKCLYKQECIDEFLEQYLKLHNKLKNQL
jgi:hypothetical protein